MKTEKGNENCNRTLSNVTCVGLRDNTHNNGQSNVTNVSESVGVCALTQG